jgi:hypothetical protein
MERLSVAMKPLAIKAKRFTAVLAAVLGGLASQQALACPAYDPFTAEEFASAPLLLAGEIIESQTISGTNSALIKFRVSERLIGHATREITLLWPGHPNNPDPPVWFDSPNVIIAAEPPRAKVQLSRPPLGYDDLRPDLPKVITQWCGPDGIMSADNQMADMLRGTIKEQQVMGLAFLLAIVAFVALWLRNFSGGSYDKRVLTELQKQPRSHAKRL